MKHSYSAGAVLVGPQGRVAVVSQHGTSWSLAKGTLEPGEDELTALKRELEEETSVTEFDIIKKLGTYDRYIIGKHGGEDKSELKTITFYLCTTNQTQLIPQDPENPEARWVDPNKVEELLTHRKDKAFYKSVLGEVKALLGKKNNNPLPSPP